MPHVTLTLTMDRQTDRHVLRHIAVVPDIDFPAGERFRFFLRQDEMPRVLYDLDTPLEAGAGFAVTTDVALPAGGYTLEVNMAATITMRYS
jgi:hypothetical protein